MKSNRHLIDRTGFFFFESTLQARIEINHISMQEEARVVIQYSKVVSKLLNVKLIMLSLRETRILSSRYLILSYYGFSYCSTLLDG